MESLHRVVRRHSLLPFMANSKARRRRMEGSALRLSAAGRVPAQITRLTRLQTGALVISLGVERGTNLTSASITFARTEISLSGRVRVIVGSAHPHNRLGYALHGSPRRPDSMDPRPPSLYSERVECDDLGSLRRRSHACDPCSRCSRPRARAGCVRRCCLPLGARRSDPGRGVAAPERLRREHPHAQRQA